MPEWLFCNKNNDMAANAPLLALTNCKSEAEATELAQWLVQQKLAACVNILPAVRSIYRWQDTLHNDSEITLLIKTNSDLFERIKNELPARHSYELPELIAVCISDGLPKYLDWVQENLHHEI